MMRTPTWWQSRGAISALLWPASKLYGLGTWLDRRFTQPQRAPIPVIAIGNATAGGAGKTPTCIALASMLQAMGEVPHIISRGYGGHAHTAHRVNPAQDDAASVGDEALLLAAIAPTWVGADRLASIRAAQQAGATLVLADDALQHHKLHKDISLLVVDATYGFGNGLLMPAGPLREPLPAVWMRSDASITIGGELDRLPQPNFTAQIAPTGDIAFLNGKRWLAFAGIAHPWKFFDTLRRCGTDLAHGEPFPDHAPYSDATITALHAQAAQHGLSLITTEKDWWRLTPDQRRDIAYLPVALQFSEPASLQAWLQERLIFLRRSAT